MEASSVTYAEKLRVQSEDGQDTLFLFHTASVSCFSSEGEMSFNRGKELKMNDRTWGSVKTVCPERQPRFVDCSAVSMLVRMSVGDSVLSLRQSVPSGRQMEYYLSGVRH